MTNSTEAILLSVLKADNSITDEQAARALRVLRGEETAASEAGLEPVLTRREVAKLIKKTPQMVDWYAAHGLLKKVTFGSSSRASGITMASVRAMLQGATAEAV